MSEFDAYVATLKESAHRERLEELFAWVEQEFPTLQRVVKWNVPMYTDHGTFIIGFMAASHHLGVNPEPVVTEHFADRIAEAGYSAAKALFRIPWNSPVDHALLHDLITYQLEGKAEITTFWRAGAASAP